MVPVSRKLKDKLKIADWVSFDPMYLQGLTIEQIESQIYKDYKLRIVRKTLIQILNFYKVQYKCNLTLKTLANKNAKY